MIRIIQYKQSRSKIANDWPKLTPLLALLDVLKMTNFYRHPFQPFIRVKKDIFDHILYQFSRFLK